MKWKKYQLNKLFECYNSILNSKKKPAKLLNCLNISKDKNVIEIKGSNSVSNSLNDLKNIWPASHEKGP